ncbi:MAG: phosphoribosylformylglycinamidine synthase subunit PurL [Acidimicrobiales bacterium]
MPTDTTDTSQSSPTPDHRSLGLTDDELDMIVGELGRDPLPVELAMYSVMWSEHCSYKSSRIHLRRLPSEGEAVLVGPGENAGVVDVGDGLAIALRIESHNHPSAVEPYQGAATGVGGILRDVFTMGARPIALMDPLFFGPLDDPRSRYIFDGVVRGVAGYGNSVGVPTVGGQLTFSPCYRGNPLVNVFCLGVLPIDRLVLGQASGVGNLVVLLGSLTGRDGIGGVSVLASAGFSQETGAKRPSVQVGDPFEEKRLIEASLDLLDRRLVVGIQDLGGAGLACATSETAARAGLGMEIDVRLVPQREPGMTPVEIMTSESQERMLAIVEPANRDLVLEICAKHEVRATVIGKVAEAGHGRDGRLVVYDGPVGSGVVVADVPASSLADDAPLYERPMREPAPPPAVGAVVAGNVNAEADLRGLLHDPSFVYRQYDHRLFLNTVLGPGAADATVLKLAAPGVPWTGKGLALTCDANPGWCAINPRLGTALTVAEAVLNISVAGARPVAVVDCMNFGNPEHPEVMWQLSESVDGMTEACRAFGVPVVGGNVSLYNESEGRDIDPTPVIGLVGVIESLVVAPPSISIAENEWLVLLGAAPSGQAPASIGGSRWARELRGDFGGPLPELDFAAHWAVCDLVCGLAAPSGQASIGVSGLHDVSEGGLGVCLAELCCAAGVGAVVTEDWDAAALFNEAPSRVVVCTPDPDALLATAVAAGVDAQVIGRAGGDRLVVPGLLDVVVANLADARARRLPEAADQPSA